MEDLNDIKYSDAIDLDIAHIDFGKPNIHALLIKKREMFRSLGVLEHDLPSDEDIKNTAINIENINLCKESMEEFLKHVYFAEKTPDTTYTMDCIDIKCNQPEPYKSKSGDWRKKSKKHKGGNIFHK